jgi:murein L,D-transpeptidase YafK
MNPKSQFHLAFNVGFPNAFDRAHGRTGAHLLVHGDCRSAGCYAMTDALVEEIYALAREALKAGQRDFQVHAFPFRMTDANMKRHARSQWMPFWRTLKPGYDDFEATRKPLEVAVCERRYLVNVRFDGNQGPAAPDAACPPYSRIKPDLFVAAPEQQKLAQSRVVVPGKKVRNLVAEAETGRGDPNSQPARRTFSFKGWALGGPIKPIQSFGFSQ